MVFIESEVECWRVEGLSWEFVGLEEVEPFFLASFTSLATSDGSTRRSLAAAMVTSSSFSPLGL
jgi:hypothetical protein